jgi:hypothetical protein
MDTTTEPRLLWNSRGQLYIDYGVDYPHFKKPNGVYATGDQIPKTYEPKTPIKDNEEI